MPSVGPISHRDLVRYLKRMGFEGPYTGGRHQYMIRLDLKLMIPNPHRGDISRDLLIRILRQAEIAREEWERL